MTGQQKGRGPYVQWEVGSKCDNVLQAKMKVPKETGRLRYTTRERLWNCFISVALALAEQGWTMPPMILGKSQY